MKTSPFARNLFRQRRRPTRRPWATTPSSWKKARLSARMSCSTHRSDRFWFAAARSSRRSRTFADRFTSGRDRRSSETESRLRQSAITAKFAESSATRSYSDTATKGIPDSSVTPTWDGGSTSAHYYNQQSQEYL